MLKVDETPVPSSAQSHLRLDWSNVCTLLLRVHLPVLETRMTNKQNKLNKRFLLRPLVLTHLPSKLCAHAPRPCSDTPSFLPSKLTLCAYTSSLQLDRYAHRWKVGYRHPHTKSDRCLSDTYSRFPINLFWTQPQNATPTFCRNFPR